MDVILHSFSHIHNNIIITIDQLKSQISFTSIIIY